MPVSPRSGLGLTQAFSSSFLPSPELLLASPKGLTLAGVTHGNTSALVKLIEEDTAGMSASALRTNRHRLKVFLQQFNQPCVIRASKVLSVLNLLSRATESFSWELAAQDYAKAHGF